MPLHIIHGLLDDQTSARLLDYAIANEQHFEDSGVGTVNEISDEIRKSRKFSDLGEFAQIIQDNVERLVPELISQLKLTPFQATGFELELIAHGDGAFYNRHIDLFTGTNERGGNAGTDRLISLVYYLNREPKGFQGGALRLYPEVNPALISTSSAVDFVPEHGVAVAFSSWLPHEVLPVSCPSGQFRDCRFAINCWVLRHIQT